jgi:cell division protein FtsZ
MKKLITLTLVLAILMSLASCGTDNGGTFGLVSQNPEPNSEAITHSDPTVDSFIRNKITFLNAFIYADDVLRHGVQSISDLINIHGIVNLDFADVSSVMKDAGYAHMGIGEGKGKDKAEVAARMAVSSPLLETSISGAKGILINITAPADIDLDEMETASAMIANEAHPEANIIWGAVIDEKLDDTIKVTVIATGFQDDSDKEEKKLDDVRPATTASAQTENTVVSQGQIDDITAILNQKRRF